MICFACLIIRIEVYLGYPSSIKSSFVISSFIKYIPPFLNRGIHTRNNDSLFYFTIFKKKSDGCWYSSTGISPLQVFLPALLIACDALNARTMTIGEYHYPY